MLNLNPLFCLDSLVQTFAVTSSQHNTSRKLINNKHLTVFYNIVNVACHCAVGFKRLVNVMLESKVLRVHKVFDIESGFRFCNTRFCEGCGFRFFVNEIIAALLGNNILRVKFGVKFLNLYHFKTFYKVVYHTVKIR